MDDHRLTTVMGVARAVLATHGAALGVSALIEAYGWDRTFSALALLRGEAAQVAFGACWERLLLSPVTGELPPGRILPAVERGIEPE